MGLFILIFNFIKNAIDTMPTGGLIGIRICRLGADESSIEKESCIIEISDKGGGISKENLGHIFQPFFSTKKPSKGAGLGLFMSKMAVDAHNGNVEVDSEVGKGTTFKITLPLAKSTS